LNFTFTEVARVRALSAPDRSVAVARKEAGRRNPDLTGPAQPGKFY